MELFGHIARPSGMAEELNCDHWIELFSASLDGEITTPEDHALESHLARCGDCRISTAGLLKMHRLVRVQSADRVPDLSTQILVRSHPPRAGIGEWIRWALLVVGLTEFVLALPALVLGEDASAPVHVARHVGSLAVAFAIGLIYVAWKPTRAYGLLPFGAALAGCMIASSALDLFDGNTAIAQESTHLFELVGIALLWRLAGSPRPRLPHLPQLPKSKPRSGAVSIGI